MDLGVGVRLFGTEATGFDRYNGITPTALIAYTFHTETGGPEELTATFYTRYQGQGFMVGVSLGVISFIAVGQTPSKVRPDRITTQNFGENV